MFHKSQKIREILGWSAAQINGDKPKSMQWDTFDKLTVSLKQIDNKCSQLDLKHIDFLKRKVRASQKPLNATQLARKIALTILRTNVQAAILMKSDFRSEEFESIETLTANFKAKAQHLIDESNRLFTPITFD